MPVCTSCVSSSLSVINFLYLHNFSAPSRIIKTRACCHLRPFSHALMAALKATMFCSLQWPRNCRYCRCDRYQSQKFKEMYLECICIFIYTYCLWCLLNKMMDDVCTFTFQVVTMHYPLLMGFAPELHGKNPKKIPFEKSQKKVKIGVSLPSQQHV